MLRVSYSDTADGERWNLCGRLAGPWVDELRSCWRHARGKIPLSRAVIDLREVTYIDDRGATLLSEMEEAGAELVASGVENKHLVANLKDWTEDSWRRTLKGLCGRRRENTEPNGGENGR